jgi:hypothetical protein
VRAQIAFALATVPLAWIPVAGCELVFPSRVAEGPADGASKVGSETSTTDASTGNDADHLGDAGSRRDAACHGPFVYNDMTSAAYWSTFDVSTVNASARGYLGGAFDGRFVYLAPTPYTSSSAGNGTVARYDTTVPFRSGTSWSTFDTAELGLPSSFFAGAVFDGRYVLLVGAGFTVRYDTTQNSFTSPLAWTTFNLTTLGEAGGGVGGFAGGVFDGRYEYLSPSGENVLRYDTKTSFTETTSWGSFNTSSILQFDAGYEYGFEGAIFDGQYVYFVPYSDIVARYDTHTSFVDASSWSTFPLQLPVDAGSAPYAGGAYDGRYVYFVPEYTGLAVRYDTHATFTLAESWSTFDMFSVSGAVVPTSPSPDLVPFSFEGAAFDGRYVYFVPSSLYCPCARITRFDSQGTFTDPAAWTTFDTTTLGPGVFGFGGAVFDGRYLYLVPYDDGAVSMADGVVARFDAKSPPCVPDLPGFSGSFL